MCDPLCASPLLLPCLGVGISPYHDSAAAKKTKLVVTAAEEEG